MQYQPSSLAVKLGRALGRRCPLCGTGIFTSWLRIRERCEGCGLYTNRGETDYFFGAWAIGFVAAEFLVAGIFFVAVFLTWPEVPWLKIEIVVLALVVLIPLLTVPFSRTLYLAFDLTFRTPEDKDFTPAERDEVVPVAADPP